MKSIVLACLVLLNTVTVYQTEGKPKDKTDYIYIYGFILESHSLWLALLMSGDKAKPV